MEIPSLRLSAWFEREATGVRGQAIGLAMITAPALVHPLALPSAVHTVVLLVAVVAAAAGALVVFGGLLIRAVLEPARQQGEGTAAWDRSYGTLTATGSLPPVDDAGTSALDDALLALPHRRAIWLALVMAGLGLAVGTLWCVVLLIAGDGAERLADALLLGLPAVALGWACWRGRVMRAAVSSATSRHPRDITRDIGD